MSSSETRPTHQLSGDDEDVPVVIGGRGGGRVASLKVASHGRSSEISSQNIASVTRRGIPEGGGRIISPYATSAATDEAMTESLFRTLTRNEKSSNAPSQQKDPSPQPPTNVLSQAKVGSIISAAIRKRGADDGADDEGNNKNSKRSTSNNPMTKDDDGDDSRDYALPSASPAPHLPSAAPISTELSQVTEGNTLFSQSLGTFYGQKTQESVAAAGAGNDVDADSIGLRSGSPSRPTNRPAEGNQKSSRTIFASPSPPPTPAIIKDLEGQLRKPADYITTATTKAVLASQRQQPVITFREGDVITNVPIPLLSTSVQSGEMSGEAPKSMSNATESSRRRSQSPSRPPQPLTNGHAVLAGKSKISAEATSSSRRSASPPRALPPSGDSVSYRPETSPPPVATVAAAKPPTATKGKRMPKKSNAVDHSISQRVGSGAAPEGDNIFTASLSHSPQPIGVADEDIIKSGVAAVEDAMNEEQDTQVPAIGGPKGKGTRGANNNNESKAANKAPVLADLEDVVGDLTSGGEGVGLSKKAQKRAQKVQQQQAQKEERKNAINGAAAATKDVVRSFFNNVVIKKERDAIERRFEQEIMAEESNGRFYEEEIKLPLRKTKTSKATANTISSSPKQSLLQRTKDTIAKSVIDSPLATWLFLTGKGVCALLVLQTLFALIIASGL